MKAQITGQVVKILAERVYGDHQIHEREFRIRERMDAPFEKYSNILPFVIKYDPTSDKYNNISELDKLKIGDTVKFSFIMRGREWTNPNTHASRCFIDLKVCSKIEVVEAAKSEAKDIPMLASDAGAKAEDDTADALDNLPF